MELYFIRHAQSLNNALYYSTGSEVGRSDDPGLTEMGYRQADFLAGHILKGNPGGGIADHPVGFNLTHIYCSLMVRAVSTGIAIARLVNLPLLGWEYIHECGGIYLDDPVTGRPVGGAGKPRDYFEKNFPELVLPESVNGSGWWANRQDQLREIFFKKVPGFSGNRDAFLTQVRGALPRDANDPVVV